MTQRSKHSKRRILPSPHPSFHLFGWPRPCLTTAAVSNGPFHPQTCLFMTRSQHADEVSPTGHLESEISRPKRALTETFGSSGDRLPLERFRPDHHGHAGDHLLASRRFEETLSSTSSNARLFCPDATEGGTTTALQSNSPLTHFS